MTSNENKSGELMTTPELCEYLKVSAHRVYTWRTQGVGPKAIRVGGTLRWRLSDVEKWLDENSSTQSDRERHA